VKVLFVGGDFDRKGGPLLLEATRRLRMHPQVPDFELHVVTRAEIPDEPGVVVHTGLTANRPELIDLYRQCEIFCLPTHADALGMVLAEAAASSMALVSTDVGAIREIVRNDETGVLIEPGNGDALEEALLLLMSDPRVRRRLGSAAHELARREHDANKNANRILDTLSAMGSRGDPSAAKSSRDIATEPPPAITGSG
jgi:glycosyltransferase involved in cell wall biosynthesis